MSDLDKKINVLLNIAHVFNENNIKWAVGASVLLYFKGKVEYFNDIDIMIVEDDANLAKELLTLLGKLKPASKNSQYGSRYFFEFLIDEVEVDLIAGFVIIKDGKSYDCSLLETQIVEYIDLNGESIPLQSLCDWRRYYELMGRDSKVEIIDSDD